VILRGCMAFGGIGYFLVELLWFMFVDLTCKTRCFHMSLDCGRDLRLPADFSFFLESRALVEKSDD